MKKIAFLDRNGTIIVRYSYIIDNMKKMAVLDRDGTLIFEPEDTKQVNGLEQLVLIKGVISALKRLQNAGF